MPTDKKDIAARVKELSEKIDAGAKAVFESESYRQYLSVIARFHCYSARNCLLIRSQYPNATRVAGYNTWKDKFRRYVRKGEHGIQILGFTPYTVTRVQPVKDDHGLPLIGPDGKPKVEEVRVKVPAYTPVFVFDISQTEGEPLPQLTHELEGTVERYQDFASALQKVSPYPILPGDANMTAYGICDHMKGQIQVRPNIGQAQALKTAIHEVAHARMHPPATDGPGRSTKEVQAESVAFVVTAYYGLDTSSYSFPYIAGWSSGKELSELMASLEAIQAEAHSLISEIDTHLQELAKNQERAIESCQEEVQAQTPPPSEPVKAAHGQSEDPAVQAARRSLGKRGIDWKSGASLQSPPKDGRRPIKEIVANAKQQAEARAENHPQEQLPGPLSPSERGDLQ